MRLVVFADLHLDAAFAWARPPVARRRRQSLRDALARILAVADEVDADAILCAGDLYEQDRFTPDTREFLRASFGATHRRVLLAPGNHDWHGRHSLYAQVAWSDNVHLFDSGELTPFELCPGLTVWGAAFNGPTRDHGFLGHGFAVDRGGMNLALFHGSARGGLPFEVDGKSPHAPFDPAEVERAGLRHAFVGHYHRPRDGEWHTYPGNPDPLTFGENGPGSAVIVDLDGEDGLVRGRRVVARSMVHDRTIDVGGCASFQEIRDRAAAELDGLAGVARLTVTGELAPGVDIDLQAMQDLSHDLDQLVVRARELRDGYDLDAIAVEPTVRGQFVRDVRTASDVDDERRRRVLITGLRALDGRADLEVP